MDNVLYCVSFRDASENGEAVPELLTALGYDFSSRRDAETLELIHTLYFKTGDDARNALQQLQSMEETFRDLDIVIEKPILSELRKEDWAESWKIHFKPIEISETLAVTPSWSDFHARPGQHVIVLDPGMSFGTGQHATTKFCLSRLDRFAAGHDVSRASMLDAGCGSGILAIAAEKLGWGEIQAFDIDPDAVRIAGEKRRGQRLFPHPFFHSLADRIQCARQDLRRDCGQHPLVRSSGGKRQTPFASESRRSADSCRNSRQGV